MINLSFITSILILLTLCCIVFLNHMLDPLTIALHPPIADKEISARTLFFEFIGESRELIAAFLWAKAELYHEVWIRAGLDWRDNTQYMPLVRLATCFDPHFVQAYDTGGFHLAINLKKVEEGIAFLEEGLLHNPDSFELLWQLSFVNFLAAHDYRNTIKYAQKAIKLPREITDTKNCLRLIAHSYAQLGQHDQAVLYWRKLLEIAPDDKPAKKFITQYTTELNN